MVEVLGAAYASDRRLSTEWRLTGTCAGDERWDPGRALDVVGVRSSAWQLRLPRGAALLGLGLGKVAGAVGPRRLHPMDATPWCRR